MKTFIGIVAAGATLSACAPGSLYYSPGDFADGSPVFKERTLIPAEERFTYDNGEKITVRQCRRRWDMWNRSKLTYRNIYGQIRPTCVRYKQPIVMR